MLTIAIRVLRDKKTTLAVYCIVSILLLWMYMALFPSIQKQAGQLGQFTQSLPEGLNKVFGFGDIDFTNLEGFLTLEYFNFLWQFLTIFLSVSFMGSLAQDMQRGTMDFVLSRPVSRLKVFIGRVWGTALAVFIFTVVSILSVVPLSELHGIEYRFSHYITTAVVGFFFSISIVGIASMFSALFSDRGRAYMLSGGILLAMYVANIVANLKEGLEDLKYLSIFHYFDPQQALVEGEVSISAVSVFFGIAIAAMFIGALVFKRRDINAA